MMSIKLPFEKIFQAVSPSIAENKFEILLLEGSFFLFKPLYIFKPCINLLFCGGTGSCSIQPAGNKIVISNTFVSICRQANAVPPTSTTKSYSVAKRVILPHATYLNPSTFVYFLRYHNLK